MTQDEIILFADASGISMFAMGMDRKEFLRRLETFAKLVAEKEREACAKVCDEYANGLERNYSEIIAGAIRARGKA